LSKFNLRLNLNLMVNWLELIIKYICYLYIYVNNFNRVD